MRGIVLVARMSKLTQTFSELKELKRYQRVNDAEQDLCMILTQMWHGYAVSNWLVLKLLLLAALETNQHILGCGLAL